MDPQGELELIHVLPILKRLAEAALTLTGLVLLTFVLLKLLPGSPFDLETPLHPLVRESLERRWDLRGSWPSQLGSYVSALARGDLGVSLVDPSRPVSRVLREGLSQTLALNLIALVAIFAVGFAAALAGSVRPGGRLDRAIDNVTIAFISLPGLLLGPLLIWLFALQWDLLPVAFLETPAHYVLPVLTLALRPAASLARILSASLREAARSEYMRTAKAKGLGPWHALFRHALRNSLIPVLAYSGPLIVGLVSGSFLVEVLFSVRGLGAAFVEAVTDRDQPVILGLTLFYGAALVAVSLALDLVMRAADPRLREGER